MASQQQQLKQQQCLKGLNWGQFELGPSNFVAMHGNQQLFSVPWQKIQNSQVLNKHDIVMELNVDENNENEDDLCEMRIYVPPNKNQEDTKSEEKSDEEEDEKSDHEEKEQIKTSATIVNEEIIKMAQISEFAGDSIATLTDIPLIVPRGKYTMDLYDTFVRFHGSTFNMKIDYRTILRAFLLPRPDETIAFVLQLSKPYRQGNTLYPFIVMQFKKVVEQEIKIKLSEEQRVQKYKNKLKDMYSGPLYDTVTKFYKIIVGVNIIIPGDFKSSEGQSSFRCSIKAHEGQLFPLQKSLIFINKPVLYIRLDEIICAEFHRIGAGISGKLFDLGIKQKNKQETVTFVGIDKKELDIMKLYFTERKVKVNMMENHYGDEGSAGEEGPGAMEEESSGDEQEGGKPGQKGKRAQKGQKKDSQKMQSEEDDSDEEDESFKAPESGGSSGSASDEDDDFDEDVQADEISGNEKPVKKQVKKN